MSGGRTSAFMTKMILDDYKDKYDIVVCFANTGQENDATLDFVNNCDKHFGFNTVWLEAVVHEEGVGTTHKIVDYETASRQGEPFLEVVKKYGVPNNGYPFCTRELKENPIHSYMKSIGWKTGDYSTAIGIRADEPKRVRRNKTRQNKVYPLVDWFLSDKQDVMQFWSEQEFDLQLHDYQGNCKWCYKKSNKKLFMIMNDDLAIFDFPKMIEEKYGRIGGNKVLGVETNEPRTLYRNYMTTNKLIELYNETYNRQMSFNFDDEEDSGCSESCEAFGTDDS